MSRYRRLLGYAAPYWRAWIVIVAVTVGSALFAFFSSVIRVPVMGSAPFTLLPRVICAPVLRRAYSAAPTLFHAGLYKILRKLGGEVPKFFLGTGRIISFWLADLFKNDASARHATCR